MGYIVFHIGGITTGGGRRVTYNEGTYFEKLEDAVQQVKNSGGTIIKTIEVEAKDE